MAYQDPHTAYYGQGKNIISSSTKGSWPGFNPISSYADFVHKQAGLSLRKMMPHPLLTSEGNLLRDIALH